MKITPPEGYIIDEEQSTIYNIVFKKKNGLPTTWEEFCKQNPNTNREYFIAVMSDIVEYKNNNIFNRDPHSDKLLLSTRENAEAHLALIQLHRLRDIYRQGWVPNYNNTLETKYSIVNIGDNIIILSRVTFRHFLTFQSYEITKLFLENFKDLINTAKELI